MKMNKSVIYTGKKYAVQDENNFPELWTINCFVNWYSYVNFNTVISWIQ